jgi:hypothetical protein
MIKMRLTTALSSVGIAGNIDLKAYDPAEKYATIGTPVEITKAYIVEKQQVMSEDYVDNMARFIQNNAGNPKNIFTTNDDIRDYFIVSVATSDGEKFMFDDESMFKNVKVGDSVDVLRTKDSLINVGYKMSANK